MNERSFLCKFIFEHPEDWMEKLHNEYEIRVKKEGDYAIFNYAIGADFSNPIVQEARGIILDWKALEVVCWPFRKFGNYTESYADKIDWASARVLEKVDGSIVKLWYDKNAEKWQFSTNGMIRAEDAGVENYPFLSYGAVICRAENYRDIPFAALDKNATYIFELVSPETRVIVNYGKTALYHLGARNNLTGEEFSVDLGVQKPQSYPLGSLEDCVRAASALNADTGGSIEKEGFVVVDKNWNRVKIKSLDYITMHHLATQKTLSKRECIVALLDGGSLTEKIVKERPELQPTVKYYDYKLCELMLKADQMVNLTRRLYEEYGNDRAAVAKMIGKHPLSFIGFKGLKGQEGRVTLLNMPVEKICSFIPDYEPIDLLREIQPK